MKQNVVHSHHVQVPTVKDINCDPEESEQMPQQSSMQMKEAALKVVELQRTVMKLRSQLKAKDSLQESNE